MDRSFWAAFFIRKKDIGKENRRKIQKRSEKTAEQERKMIDNHRKMRYDS